MKLFLTVVLASVLMMKTAEGADKGLEDTCVVDTDTCTVANTACIGADGAKKCSCTATYTQPTPADGTCKKKAGEVCTAVGDCAVNVCTDGKCGKANGADCTASTDCAANACTKEKCGKATGDDCTVKTDCAADACTNTKCGKANDATCTMNTDCLTFNCKYMDASTEKCADAGGAGVVASVLLMVATLMTSRIL